MKNDHEGRLVYRGTETFYASGQRGNEVRSDGKGGNLARGYYALTPTALHGPFNSRAAAWRHVGVEPTGCAFRQGVNQRSEGL